jgi:hypothetical protein
MHGDRGRALILQLRREEAAMIKVIQWATGTVGRHAIEAVVAHPDLKLVGTYVHSAAKAGRDVGQLCGLGPIGVVAGNDKSAIFEMDADCVLYMAQGEANPDATIDDICRLLASGKNVISTALTVLIYPKAAGAQICERIELACRAGGTSFHGTGIEPGWAAEVLPLTLSPLCRRIDSILVQEIFDYATYPSVEMLFGVMGFGKPGQSVPPIALSPGQGGAFLAPLMMVADALGATIEGVIYRCDLAFADRAYDVSAGHIEAGTVAGKRYSFTAMIGGRPALTVEHITRLGAHIAPEWPTGRGWHVTIEGKPSMVLRAQIGADSDDQNDQACLATAMHAVHAIVPVCAAPVGIRTFIDLPLVLGRRALYRAPDR